MPCSLRIGRHLAAAFVIVSLSTWCPCGAVERSPKPASDAPSAERTASELVRQALEAEAAGNVQERTALLKRALKASPDHAAAHWQLGELRIGNRWLSIDAASREASREGKLDQYQELRASAGNTYDDQLRLARFCAGAGLKDQERQHLLNALRVRPKSREVIARLGLVRHRSRLMPAEQATFLKEQAQWSEAASKEWKPQLTRLKLNIEGSDRARREAALDELRAIRDPAAIPLIESTFAKGPVETGRAVIACLTEIPDQAATDSLVRHAVFAPQADVREAAARAMKPRSVFSYVPQLLSGLAAPIEVQFNTFNFEGAIGYRLSLFREGPLFNASHVATSMLAPNYVPTAVGVPIDGSPSRSTPAPRPAPPNVTPVAGGATGAAATAAAALEENARTEQMNDRIAAVLRMTTDADMDADPRQWWDWWSEYNEIHYPPTKPLYESVRYSFTTYNAPLNVAVPEGPAPPPPPPLPMPRYHSCFVAGTPVWTLTGSTAIEKIQVGDAVLSQNVDTGELAYKAVTATTVGPRLPLVSLRAGKEAIRSTRGHLFWVDGSGWRMAKDLKAGDLLHTARGALAIDSVEDGGEASCHNLVVTDYNTYFVTDSQVLVHDINVRGPTTATVPGLVK